MQTVGATFTDHEEVERTVRDLHDAGAVETRVIPLADVDPPYADPVLVAVRVDDGAEQPVRRILRAHGGSLLEGSLGLQE